MALKLAFLSRLRKRERILLAVAGAAAGLYFLISPFAIPRLQRYRLNGSLIEDKEKILAGYHETLEKERDLNKRLGSLEAASTKYQQFMLQSDKPALAAAELQNMVKEASGDRGLDIISEKIVNPTKGEDWVNIPVEVTASGAIGPLRDLIYSLESGQPLLTIPEITIRANKKRSFDAATKKYIDVDELQATILINGMMKGGM